MDGPKNPGGTAAGEATANASTEEVAPLGHDASSELRRSKQFSASVSVDHGTTLQVNNAGDVRGMMEEPAAQVPGSGPYGSSLNAKTPSTAAAGTQEEDLRGSDILFPGATNTGKHSSSSMSTEASSSSSPSSPSMESNSYISFQPLIDESWGKNNLQRHESDSEETCDGKYQKKIDKGKGKEIVSRGSGQESAPPAEGQQSRPLVNNVPWVQDPERPPQKLPIRFTDCLGRNFVWPWTRAKTWKGAKKLIESAFLYVEILGPRVFAGHYELTIQEMWSDPKTAAINPTLASYPPEATQQLSSTVPPGIFVDSYGASTSASSSFQPGHPPPSASVPPHPPPKPPGRGAIILPELWEYVVEPGMLISMRMWPISHSPSTYLYPQPLPVPMPPPAQSHGVGAGRGRGRGAGPAPGLGSMPMPPPPPPPPPGWSRRRGPPIMVIPYRSPKGKTRKRQDGL